MMFSFSFKITYYDFYYWKDYILSIFVNSNGFSIASLPTINPCKLLVFITSYPYSKSLIPPFKSMERDGKSLLSLYTLS